MQENQKKVKQKQTKGTVTEKLVVLDTKDVLKVEKDIARLRGCALSSALKSRGYVVDFNINSAYHYTVRSTQAFYQQRKNRKPHEIEMEINERKKNVKKPKPPRDISSKSIKSKYSFKRKLRSRPKRHNFALDDDLLEIDNLDHITINSKDSFDHFDGVINIDNVDSIGKEFINRSDSIEEKEYNKGKIVVDVTPNTNMNTVKIIPKFSPTIGKYSFNESQNIITVGSVEHYPNLIIGENQQEISCINVSDENISNVEIVTPASQKNCIKETKELCTNDPQSYLEKQVDSNTNYDGQELCFSISSNSSKTRSVIQKPIKPPKTQQTEKTKNKLVQPHSTKFFRNEHIQESLKKPRKERKELDKNLIACRDILNKLKVLPEAGPFLSAVDPVAMNLPDYYYVVTNPMDLGTVQKKMRQRKYSTVDAFASDVRLVFHNAMLYNPPRNMVHIFAAAMLKYFNEKIKALLGSDVILHCIVDSIENHDYWGDKSEWFVFRQSIDELQGKEVLEEDEKPMKFEDKIELAKKIEEADGNNQKEIIKILQVEGVGDTRVDIGKCTDSSLWKIRKLLE